MEPMNNVNVTTNMHVTQFLWLNRPSAFRLSSMALLSSAWTDFSSPVNLLEPFEMCGDATDQHLQNDLNMFLLV